MTVFCARDLNDCVNMCTRATDHSDQWYELWIVVVVVVVVAVVVVE